MSSLPSEMDDPNIGDVENGTQNSIKPAAPGKIVKGFATKKGPKLTKGRGKPPTTIASKSESKGMMKKYGGKA